MCDLMEFPETVEEFMEKYKTVDTEQVYSNGTEYVPIFRMKQWFQAHKAIPVAWLKKYANERALNDGMDCYWHFWEEDLLQMIEKWEKENADT